MNGAVALKVDVKVEKVNPCRRCLKIEVPSAEVRKELDAVYQEFARTAKIPGFRAGKVPRQLIEQRFAKEAQEELLKRVIPQAYSQAVQEKKLHPVGHPHVKEVQFKQNEPLTFQALLDISPEFKLKNYKGIALKRKKVQVKEEEIDQALENLRQQQAQFNAVTGRGLREKDFAIADWEIRLDGKTAEQGKGAWFLIEEKSLFEGLFPALLGAAAGEKREAKIKLPPQYKNKALAGKEALFVATVNEIKERVLPELNDDFAKELGKYETLAQVREELKKQLGLVKERNELNSLKSQAVEYLLKENKFDLPQFLVEEVAEDVMQRAVRQMYQRGATEKDVQAQFEAIQKTARERAESDVRFSYLVDEISKSEAITLQKEDTEKYLAELVVAGQNPAYLQQALSRKENAAEMQSRILEEKVLQFLISQGKIKEED